METSLVARRVKSRLCALSRRERESSKTTMNKDLISVWTGLGKNVPRPAIGLTCSAEEEKLFGDLDDDGKQKKNVVQTA